MSVTQDNEYIETLKKKIADKEKEIVDEVKKATSGMWGGMVITIILIIIAYLFFSKRNVIIFNILFYLILIVVLVCLAVVISCYHDIKVTKHKNIELDSLKEELELEQIPDQNIIVRADKQFKINQKDLQRYYDLNLSQTKFLSKLGILLILFGLLIISSSIFSYINLKTDLWILITGAISGILVDFIGTIFITMYTKSLDASVKFHSKLASSSNLLLANSIATKISDESLRESTLSEIAKNIVYKDHNKE